MSKRKPLDVFLDYLGFVSAAAGAYLSTIPHPAMFFSWLVTSLSILTVAIRSRQWGLALTQGMFVLMNLYGIARYFSGAWERP